MEPISTVRFTELVEQMRQFALTSTSLAFLQTYIVQTIARELRHYDWVGFYMLDPVIRRC